MRQGPTNGGGVTNNPNNLAFGRPPVCILRIGDFYHTKIIIENLNFTFEPLVWDLNPEGVGVQPMICNVDMSFSFIGGSSLRGPINKLQNAVSFNYFANSEVYDPRADTIKITDSVKNTGEIKNGINYSSYNILPDGPYITGLGPNTEPTKNQVAENNNANSQNNTEIGDLPKLTAINFISVLHSSSMNDSTGKQNDIVIKMDSENIITGGFVVESTVKPFVEQGIKITITSIPIPNFITNVVIDNKFNYEEIVKFDDGNQKSISALVSTGYRIGDNVGGNADAGSTADGTQNTGGTQSNQSFAHGEGQESTTGKKVDPDVVKNPSNISDPAATVQNDVKADPTIPVQQQGTSTSNTGGTPDSGKTGESKPITDGQIPKASDEQLSTRQGQINNELKNTPETVKINATDKLGTASVPNEKFNELKTEKKKILTEQEARNVESINPTVPSPPPGPTREITEVTVTDPAYAAYLAKSNPKNKTAEETAAAELAAMKAYNRTAYN